MIFLSIFIISSLIFFSYNYRKSTFYSSEDSRELNEYLYGFDFNKVVRAKSKPTPEPLISRESKQNYLSSPQWQTLKRQRLALANHKCENCRSTSKLELHHVTYVRLMNEHINDVAILCNSCHSKLHKLTGYDRLTLHHLIYLKAYDATNNYRTNEAIT